MKIELTVEFGQPGYIADPYWPERERLINIQKESGVNRARSAAARRKCLEDFLRSAGMTLAEYEALEAAASRPFYTTSPTPTPTPPPPPTPTPTPPPSPPPTPTSTPTILIPQHHVYGLLVSACDESRSAGRPCPPNSIRAKIAATAWITDKTQADGIWERFVTVTAGTGAKLSNQRALRRNAYIECFEATGTLEVDPQFVNPKALRQMIEFGGLNVGIGACRKMGYGRFRLTEWVEK